MSFSEDPTLDDFHVFNPSFVRSVWRKRRKAEGRKPPPPRTRHNGWTPDELAAVAEGVRKNMTRQQIARSIGRTKNAVTGVIHRNPQLARAGEQQ
ncbi:hypothetical protein [Mesorhizobium caraganae]|uniref:hypothetical protein n=1 Tax=Mesorhizobium caraganae TaxID=483206 RepID=UPI00177B2891|nr:hypothetical protein [Mesorhizobium caraganae]